MIVTEYYSLRAAIENNNGEPFFGENEDGEHIFVTMRNDVIELQTYQSNDWICKRYFYSDGTVEELYEK